MPRKPTGDQLSLNLPKPGERRTASEGLAMQAVGRVVSLSKKRGEKERAEIAKLVSSIVRRVSHFK